MQTFWWCPCSTGLSPRAPCRSPEPRKPGLDSAESERTSPLPERPPLNATLISSGTTRGVAGEHVTTQDARRVNSQIPHRQGRAAATRVCVWVRCFSGQNGTSEGLSRVRIRTCRYVLFSRSIVQRRKTIVYVLERVQIEERFGCEVVLCPLNIS